MPEHFDSEKRGKRAAIVLLFVFIWAIAGIIAFFISIFCMFKSGTITDKAVGFLLAVVLGPLYFIYFAFNKNYCGNQIKSKKH